MTVAILEWLRTPLGPLPMWVWIVAGAAVLWLIKRFRGQGPVEAALSTPTAGPATNEDGINDPLDNDAWGLQAISGLVNQGMDPVQADYAIRTYLGGGDLDPSMLGLINAAFKNQGPPPELLGDPGGPPPKPSPVLPTPNQPAVSTNPQGKTTSTANPNYKTISYKIQKGDTFKELSEKYNIPVEKLRKDSGVVQGQLGDRVGQTIKLRVRK